MSSSSSSSSSGEPGVAQETKTDAIVLDVDEEEAGVTLAPIANEVGGAAGGQPAARNSVAGRPPMGAVQDAETGAETGKSKLEEMQGYVVSKKEVLFASLEVLMYVLFLIVFCLFAYGSRNSTYSFHYNNMMKDLFLEEEFPSSSTHILKTFYDVATIEEAWQYLRGPLVSGLSDNGSNGPQGYIYGVNRLIGSARLRQLRVRPGDCPLLGAFKHSFQTQGCLAPYNKKYESRTTYSAGTPPFRYVSEDNIGGFEVLGRITRYDGGGFVEYLNGTASDDTKLAFLEANNWLDAQTRALVIDFSTYNANINMFFVGQIVMEFLPSGGVLPSAVFRVMRFYRYPDTGYGRFQIFLEVAVVIFVLFYIVQEVLEMIDKKLGYLADGWNFFDIVNLLLFIVLFIFRIVITIEFNDLGLQDYVGQPKYYNFTNLVTLTSAEYNIMSLNGFLLFFKMLKYARFSKSALIITKTIKRAIASLAAFMTMIMFVLLGFAFFGNQSFGIDVADYRTFTFSIFTMLRGLLGELDFEQLWLNNRLFGPIFYVAFVMLFVFILLNMFLAIIDEAYTRTVDKHGGRPNPHALWMHSLKKYARKKMPNRIKEWRAAVKKEKALQKAQLQVIEADTNRDNQLDRTEATQMLESQQHMAEYLGVNNVDDLFAMYDVDQDGVLDLEEQAIIMDRLEAERARYQAICQDIAADGGIPEGESVPVAASATTAFHLRAQVAADDANANASLGGRVDALETMVGSLHGKVDVALDFLRSISESQTRAVRARRRRTASITSIDEAAAGIGPRRGTGLTARRGTSGAP